MGTADYVNAKTDAGCLANNVQDETDRLLWGYQQATSTGRKLYLPSGSYKHTAPLHLLNAHIVGDDPGGAFYSVLRPYNCRAFSSVNEQHSTVSNLMIWPQGDTPPDCYIYVNHCYSHVFRDVRIHLAVGQPVCTVATVFIDGQAGPNNNLIFENLISRSDGSYYPASVKLAPNCGTVQFITPDFETAGYGFVWNGGKITVQSPYTERMSGSSLKAQVEVSDTAPMFSVHGGMLSANHSGMPIQIYANAKNLTMHGTFLKSDLGQYEGFFYSADSGQNVSFHGCAMNLAKWNRRPVVFG